MLNYILDDEHNIVPVTDLIEWAKWFEKAKRRVGDTTINNHRVSTVFLGLDHRFGGDGPPILFETMVFDMHQEAMSDVYCRRCCTWAEAEKMHQEAVDWVNNGMVDN